MTIAEILKKYGVVVPEDKVDDFNKDFRVNYKSAAEHRKVREALETANAELKNYQSSDYEGKLADLQSKYEADVKKYEDQMAHQKYEFAVKEFANTKDFSSEAAKRDFTREMLAKNLQMDGDRLIGADDFVSIYSQANADAFRIETPEPEPVPEPEPTVVEEPIVEEPIVEDVDVPEFMGSAQGFGSQEEDWDFGFQGVRAH